MAGTGGNEVASGVTREEIRTAYVCLLGREPESEAAYLSHSSYKDVFKLRRALLTSAEYYRRLAAIGEAHQKDALFFMHLEKTGGTTLHHALAQNFDPAAVSPPHYGFEVDYLMAEATYAFFSGHFDYNTVLKTPRKRRRVVSIFRDPADRLKSQYRFWRSHPILEDVDETREYVLAKELSPEEFFSDPTMRASPLIDNYYLRAFGTNPPSEISASLTRKEVQDALELAEKRIRSLDGVGLTHKMEQSVTQICSALGFRAPEELNSLNVTDSLPEEDPCFAKVENFELTTRFKAIIEDLVVYDQLLFYAAATEFYWRSKFLMPPVKSESAVSTLSA